MASALYLQEWCRVTCANYPSVEIKNMSSSFRDGLAFCAIIHKHQPHLIDFSSLSKDNAYQNNKLAFEVAENKLGIPALLDPKDMVSTQGPDCLSVVTYLSHLYYFFNRKSCGGSRTWSLPITVLNNVTKSKQTPDVQKSLKSSTDLEASREDCFANTRTQTVCNLCFKPVHLIQRHLIDGKVYHRSCFRCKVCHCTFSPGSDTCSLICACHEKDSKSISADVDQEVELTDSNLKCTFQAGLNSSGELTVTTKKLDSQERLVSKTQQKYAIGRPEGSREVKGKGNSCVRLPHPPQPTVKERTAAEDKRNKLLHTRADSKEQPNPAKSSELLPSSSLVTEKSARPVPAPRRSLDALAVPVPAPRTKTALTMSSSRGVSDTPSGSSKISPSLTVKNNHPWMTIVHPGPWTQLPLAPPPVPLPRSKPVPNCQGSWSRPKIPPPNPFEEEEVEDTQQEAVKPESGDISQTEPSDVTKDLCAISAQSHSLPRSLSVPAITPEPSPVPAESNESVTLSQRKPACKENPFNRKPEMSKSKTFQDMSSSRGPAPGYGFPLIKRKVQTDQGFSVEDLQAQMRDLHHRLETLEQRGVELEKILRDDANSKNKEEMLTEWFALIHERQILLRKDSELVSLTKQQRLEDRQADVEYQLRCLLNKPESDWSSEDRDREQQLMVEMVAVIEQRNQIISSLDKDRQREREEDLLWQSMVRNKDFQKERLKELKKSKGKFKPAKVFKLFNYKTESGKDSEQKKN